MARKKNKNKPADAVDEHRKALRRAHRENMVGDLREGRKPKRGGPMGDNNSKYRRRNKYPMKGNDGHE